MFQNRETLTNNLTSYDFLKAVALILMVIDHIGVFFFPDEMWLRVIGRLCVPMWFFLVGYASSRDFSRLMWFSLLALVWVNFMIGMYILPLNILASILIVRFLIDAIAERMMLSRCDFIIVNMIILLFVFLIPSQHIFEYGGLAFVMAIAGYLVKNKDSLGFSNKIAIFYLCFSYVVYTSQVLMWFEGIDNYMISFFVVSLAVVTFVFYNFRGCEYPVLTSKLPSSVVSIVQFMGRQTLFIYVVHFIMFKMTVIYLGYANVEWFYLRFLP